jgi:hypothetical protein
MYRNQDIWNELHNISAAVANLNHINALEAPETDYFANFAGEVLKRIKAGEAGSPSEELQILSPVLYGIGKTMPFDLEPLYFDMLPGEVLENTKSQDQLSAAKELEAISPLLSKMERKSPMKVPEGYFEGLKPIVPIGMNGKRPAKVISMNRRKWVNYAAAAVITGFIAVSAWLIFNNRSARNETVASVNIEEALKASTESEMINYLEAMPSAPVEEVPFADLQDIDAEAIIEELPDNVLQKYLLENPEIRENQAIN